MLAKYLQFTQVCINIELKIDISIIFNNLYIHFPIFKDL
jgi:hypothetical protein